MEAVSGVWNEAQMGEGVWGVLKGRVVRYEIRAERVLIGRSTAKHEASSNFLFLRIDNLLGFLWIQF